MSLLYDALLAVPRALAAWSRRNALEAEELQESLALARQWSIDGKTVNTAAPKGTSSGDRKVEDIFSESDYYEILDQSLDLWFRNQTYRGAIDTCTRFVWGTGPDVKAELPEVEPGEDIPEEQQHLASEADAYWWAWWDANRMDIRGPEAVASLMRDGNVFFCFAASDLKGVAAGRAETGDGKPVAVPLFKLLSPRRIKDTAGKDAYGVLLDAKGEPAAYHYQTPDGASDKPVPASLVQHVKANGDDEWRVGYPWLLQSFAWFRKMDRLLDAFLNKAELQACAVLQKKFANPGAAQTASATHLKSTSTATEDPYVQKRIHPGTVFTTGPGVEYQFLAPQMAGPPDTAARLFDLQTVRNSGLAECMLTGDASNNNYASALVAESPAVRAFEFWRLRWAYHLRTLRRYVIDFGVEAGHLPGNTPRRSCVEWDPLVSRNSLDEAKALDLDVTHGLSRRTYLTRRGYDPETEEAYRKIEDEADYDADAQAQDQEAGALAAMQAAKAMAKAQGKQAPKPDEEAPE